MTIVYSLSAAPKMPADPIRLLIYGVPGIGKSTFAVSRPKTVLFNVGAESSGKAVISLCQRGGGREIGPIQTWDDVIGWIGALQRDPHDFTTLALDSLTALQPLAQQSVLQEYNKGRKEAEQAATVGDINGGKFGAGYTLVAEKIRYLLAALERLQRARGLGLILVAHAADKEASDAATGGNYESVTLDLSPSVSKPVVAWCNEVLFARWDTQVIRVAGKPDDPGRLIQGTGGRIVRTQQDGPWVAKNRGGMPPWLPLDWGKVEPYLRGGDEIYRALQALLPLQPAARRPALQDRINQARDPVALAAIEAEMLSAGGAK